MRKLNMKTVEESSSLTNAWSNQALSEVKIFEIINDARKFEKGKSLDKLWEIVDNYKKRIHPTKPKRFSENVRSTGETAYQRAIFLSKKTYFHSLGDVVWNDLELPVIFNGSSRRRCVDLVGTLNGKTSVLCELKFASKTNSNSPVYAVIELLIYFFLIQDNCYELDSEKVFHGNVKSFDWANFNFNSIFIIGANERYWKHWKQRYEKHKNGIESWRSSLLPLKFRFFSSTDHSDFEAQKGSQDKYRPSLSDKTEWTEVSL